MSTRRELRYWSLVNPWACAACGHLPAAHEDGAGGLGACFGWPTRRERRWWRRRGCHCPGYVPKDRQ